MLLSICQISILCENVKLQILDPSYVKRGIACSFMLRNDEVVTVNIQGGCHFVIQNSRIP